jgi:hypothetical protein
LYNVLVPQEKNVYFDALSFNFSSNMAKVGQDPALLVSLKTVSLQCLWFFYIKRGKIPPPHERGKIISSDVILGRNMKRTNRKKRGRCEGKWRKDEWKLKLKG